MKKISIKYQVLQKPIKEARINEGSTIESTLIQIRKTDAENVWVNGKQVEYKQIIKEGDLLLIF